MNDFIIIGGGISGLYSLNELHKYNKNYKIMLFDERSYLGGRVITHKQPHYEIGGARFNNNHVLTQKLIKEYKLNIIPINSKKLFIHKNNNSIKYFHNVNETFDIIIKNIIKESKKYDKKFIQKFTLKEFIDYISKSKELSKKIKDIFGYHSEIYEMNAYNSLNSMKLDFIHSNFYIIQEGYSELCNRIFLNHYKNKNIKIKKNTKIMNIVKENDYYKVVTSNNKEFYSKKIINEIKAQQLSQFNILKPIFPYLNSVYNASLLRIYAKYPKQNNNVWFKDLPVITTNSF